MSSAKQLHNEEWMKLIIHNPFKNKIPNIELNLKSIFENYNEKITCSEIINYLYYYWINKLCAKIDPDMLWFTIINEINTFISENTKEHIDIVKNFDKKTTIIANTKFNSQSENFNIVVDNKTKTSEIFSVELLGCIEDYMLLQNNLTRLKNLLKYNSSLNKYFSQCLKILDLIIYYSFGVITTNFKENYFENKYENKQDFLSCIFVINKKHGSNTNYLEGWIKNLYIN